MKKIVTQTMIDRKWDGGKSSTKEEVVDGFHGMRPWQKRAFALLKDRDYMTMNAPMGSGKSWEICLLSSYKMKQDAKLRTIIAVPQGIIGNGFKKADILLPDGEKLHWEPKHWLCDGNGSRKNTDYVIAWLKSKPAELADRVVVCTHSTILNVYKRLKETKKLALLKNLMLWIDEAHHVRNTKADAKKKLVFSNGIGGLVAHAVKSNGSIKVGLATATFFRGDCCTLLTDEMVPRFTRFSLAFDEHLGDMEYLRSFTYKFLLCGPDYTKAMVNVFRDYKGKFIIHIPSPNSNHSTGPGRKYEEVAAIAAAFKKAYGGRESEPSPGLTVLKGKTGEFKILDLVDENDRDAKKEFTQTINESRESLDAIIALGMCKEGFDWVHADRSVIVGSRGSLVDVIQTIGRLFRDTPGKDHVEVIQMLPFSFDQLDKEKHREELNNYMKCVYGSMILEDMIDPIKIKGPSAKRPGGETEGEGGVSLLSILVPDESERIAIKHEVGKRIVSVQAEADASGADVGWDDFKVTVPPILAEHDIPEEHRESLSEYILTMFARVSAKMKGIDVRKVDYEILHKISPSAGIFDYVSKAFDIESFKELKVAIETSVDHADLETHMKILHEMRENGQPIKTADEYRAWVRCGQDYEAVLRFREAV